MTNSEPRSLAGVDTEGRASNFADRLIVAVPLNQDACWIEKPPICHLVAIAPLLARVATTMTPPKNV